MSTEELPTILLRRCRERNCIRLKKEYLQSWKERRLSPISNIEAAYEELVSDFKKTDIATTSEPVIAQDNGQLPDSFPPGQFHQGVVLQIQDTWDISHSLFSQLNNLKDGIKIPRGMLRWTLSDGTSLIHARETENIQGLELMTPFGTKLLVKSCQVKHGMLQLSNKNTTLMGGNVADMCGDGMLAELQKRIKEQLDATTEPNSPMPTDTNRVNINRANTNHANTNHINTNHTNTNHTNTNNIRSYTNTFNNTHTDPRLAAELNDLNNVDMSLFDDADMDQFEDTVMGEAMDEFDDNLDFNDNSITQTIPSAPPINNDSDDDFVTTQPVPVRPRLSKKPVNTASAPRPTTADTVSDLKRPGEAAESTFSKRLKDETADTLLVKKEKAIVDSIHWIDPSTWLDDDDDDEIDGVEVKPDGTTHVTFDALHRILGQMSTDSFTGSIADRITVHVKFIKMARMRFSKLTGFYALFDIGDPLEKNKETVRILIGNKLFMELLGLDPKNVLEFGEAIKDSKKAKKILVPFDKRMRAKQLEVQLNVNIMEKELSDDGTGEHFVPPTFSLKVLST
ncbi:hypothetical protein BDF21DRAFT_451829 [Thamnidium elegans]|nr:hypothetical protein BDF21DRAFT_451829 [Thamnidium elegans]